MTPGTRWSLCFWTDNRRRNPPPPALAVHLPLIRCFLASARAPLSGAPPPRSRLPVPTSPPFTPAPPLAEVEAACWTDTGARTRGKERLLFPWGERRQKTPHRLAAPPPSRPGMTRQPSPGSYTDSLLQEGWKHSKPQPGLKTSDGS